MRRLLLAFVAALPLGLAAPQVAPAHTNYCGHVRQYVWKNGQLYQDVYSGSYTFDGRHVHYYYTWKKLPGGYWVRMSSHGIHSRYCAH